MSKVGQVESIRDRIDALMPRSEWARPGWGGCLVWAIGSKEIRDRYEAETGDHYKLSSSPIEQMIDEATGVQGEWLVNFITWMNRNIWGENEGRACDGNEPEPTLADRGG
jgi:hypothetical protein